MLKTFKNLILLTSLSLIISGCMRVHPLNMTAYTHKTPIPSNNIFKKNLKIKKIGGASAASAYLFINSYINDSLFEEAVRQSFKNTELLNKNGTAKYELSVFMVSLALPMHYSLSAEPVTTTISYQIDEIATGKNVFGKAIQTTTTAGCFQDREAIEYCVKNNLNRGIKKIIKKGVVTPKQPTIEEKNNAKKND